MGVRISSTSDTGNQIAFGGAANFSGQSPFTLRLIMRINADPSGADRFFGKGSATFGTEAASADPNTANVLWFISSSNVGDISSAIGANGEWADYTLSYDNAVDAQYGLYLAVNGQLVLTVAAPLAACDTNASAFTIGAIDGAGSGGAPIDVAEFEWMDTPLGTSQLLSLYNGGVFNRLQDIGQSPSHYYAMLPESSPTDVQDAIGAIDGVGTGTTSTTHPTMLYLQPQGGGPRSQRYAKTRGLSIPRLRRVAR